MRMLEMENQPATILVVEDNTVMVRLIEEILRLDRHFVRVANTTAEALDISLKCLPDLVICDLNLPDGDGLSLIKSIKNQHPSAFIPTMIVSARVEQDDIIRGMAVAQDYLNKPVDPNELRVRVGSMLRLKRMQTRIEDLNRDLERTVLAKTKELHEKNRELRSLAQSISQIQESEQRRVAGEIHDAFGTSLLTLKLLVQSHLQELDPGNATHERRTEIIDLIDTITAEARNLAHSLTPIALHRLGLVATIRDLVDGCGRANPGVQFTFTTDGSLDALPAQWNLHIYRITQECIGNALKHGNPGKIEILLKENEGHLTLTISDDGKGLEPASQDNGMGLLFMKERAIAMNGLLEIRRIANAGTEVCFESEIHKD
ncbi:MAG: response regulator [Spirochaetia bacterium]|nr:response regulator [Spirochaetia bacterium]